VLGSALNEMWREILRPAVSIVEKEIYRDIM
jgi:hypothetical protein